VRVQLHGVVFGLEGSDVEAVSVIMPTRVLKERGALLRRALESVLAQQGVRVVPLVVINGPAVDPALATELRADRRLRVATLEQADLPAALRAGRSLVDTVWFAELDDDDVLLPGALAARVRALEERPECQAVVTNGLIRDSRGDSLHVPDASIVQRDPLRALLKRNWLLPGSWLCRTESVGLGVFEGMPRFAECTYLAIRLATKHQMRFLDSPTVVWHTDSPLSVSRSRDYVLGQGAALRRILELELPSDVRAAYRTRVSSAYHEVARLHLREGTLREAWRWHIQSLGESGGWRYVPFARRLVHAWWSA
jgi:glycosyltransferase involved in cell wall biosynthesis